MSDSVLIVLVIAVTIVVVLFMFRKRLSRFIFKANRDGLESTLEAPGESAAGGDGRRSASQPTLAPGGVRISRNWLVGRNRIDVGRGDVEVDRTKQLGRDQSIVVRPDPQRDQV